MSQDLVDIIVERVMARLESASPSQAAPPADPGPVTEDIRSGRVMLGVSARHIHLTDEHVEILFGPGSKLTVMRPLLQPGEFASEQQLLLASPAGRTLGPVRVLGPTRKASQVEISLTDCYALGLKKLPPIRPSGDHRDTFGITLIGPAGAVALSSGLIRANRHIHLHSDQAAAMGLRDKDTVDVRVDGERPAVLVGCQIRANPAFRAEMHLDTDDANAIGAKSGDTVQILLGR